MSEVTELRKKLQKLESNMAKGSDAARVDRPCICGNPHFIHSTATRTGRICTICAGV